MEKENKETYEENPSFLFNLKDDNQKSDYLYLSHSESDEIQIEKKSEKKEDEEYSISNNSMNDISLIKDEDNNDEFSIYNDFRSINNKFYKEIIEKEKRDIPIEIVLEECKYLIDIFKKNKEIFKFKDIIIRCFRDEGNENKENNNCYCIPIIYKSQFGMIFSCDNKNYKYLRLCDIFKKILENKLFIKINKPKKNYNYEQTINNNENTIKINLIKVDHEGYKKLQKLSQYYFEYYCDKSKKNIDSNKIDLLIDDYNKNEEQRIEINRKIRNFHKNLIININNYTYFFIIKKLIKESFSLTEENNSYENMKIDIELAEKLINYKESIKKDKYFLKYPKKKIRIKWITHLYYKDEIINDINKNIFITIGSHGYIAIFLFNIAFRTLTYEKFQYKKLLEKRIDKIKLLDNILNIKKCYDKKDIQENHYFLISSIVEEKALIIKVSEKAENPLEERYKMEEIEIIDFERGLYSSIEIEYKGNYYLLNYHKVFDLWYYNEIKNKFDRKEIKVLNYIPDDTLGKKSQYGPLIHIKNKNLIIALVTFPIQRIEVYSFDEIDKFICLKFLKFLKLEKSDNFINPCNNDYFVYKDRYLLLASEVNKNIRNKGGIYLFDLDNLTNFNLIEFNDINNFNCLLGINNDTMICSIELVHNNMKKNIYNKDGGLILLKIEEKDNKIFLRRIENKIYQGKCNFITYKDFVYESYFICSSFKDNGVFRLNENNEFVHYFNISTE